MMTCPSDMDTIIKSLIDSLDPEKDLLLIDLLTIKLDEIKNNYPKNVGGNGIEITSNDKVFAARGISIHINNFLSNDEMYMKKYNKIEKIIDRCICDPYLPLPQCKYSIPHPTYEGGFIKDNTQRCNRCYAKIQFFLDLSYEIRIKNQFKPEQIPEDILILKCMMNKMKTKLTKLKENLT